MKCVHTVCLLFTLFGLGQFLEGIFSDQEITSQQLDLSLTKNPVPGPCIPKKIHDQGSGSDLSGASSSSSLTGVQLEICRTMEWNMTYHRNLLSYDTKSYQSFHYIGTWQPLVEMDCSPNIERLLCSLVVPICNPRKDDDSGFVYILPPCKELCEHARSGCSNIMKTYGFPWPFDCDSLSSGIKEGDTEYTGMCVPPNLAVVPPDGTNKDKPSFRPNHTIIKSDFVCPKKLTMGSGLGYSFLQESDCSAPCKEVLFSDEDYIVARYWIGAWSSVCFFSSLFTLCTFAIDKERFKYPERPIIILSGCYVVISLTFIVGFFAQNSISCNSVDAETENSKFQVVAQSVAYPGCTISFFVLYYFLMASSLWWVILSFTWFLAAGLKWSPEAIEGKAVVFHVIAWIIPLFQTILVLFFQGIEGDDISGTCFTGIINVQYTRFFILLPLMLFLLIGFIFLMCGFVSMCRVRHFIKRNGDRTDKLEKLMMRIGIFSLFYMVPAVVLIACFFYEQTYREKWQMNWWKDNCHNYENDGKNSCIQLRRSESGLSGYRGSDGTDLHPTANFYVFLLRYFVTLAVGVTSSFWLWSRKTLSSWRAFLCSSQVGSTYLAGSSVKKGGSTGISVNPPRKPVIGGGGNAAFV